MSKQLLKSLAIFALALVAGTGAVVADESIAATEQVPLVPATTADAEGTAARCDQAESISFDLGTDLVNPSGTPVCTFCNLSGFVNCESTDGKSCSAPGTNRRCYINPPCACEWGFCRCDGASGTWQCFW